MQQFSFLFPLDNFKLFFQHTFINFR
uniref:Uncharacterized protein n=1 Tax=Lotus japonicus TaxID=34305 RepID=I3T482_LOTJA|nr:unknown [Lotus japonicus]